MEKEILAKLKKLREEKGVRPMELAVHLDIDESAYNRMENGVNNTWGKYLLPLLDFYKIPPSEFFKDIEGKNFIHQDVKEINDNGQNIAGIDLNFSTDASVYQKLIQSYEKTIKALEDKIQLLEEKLNHIMK
ncbi:MAG: helix-turn-helix domain-containing protein [Chitinophagales bacterium]|jgi:transcriptional regulator with XRE-family HTH domain|nr:helix-turn-helix transcriptional regulator [Sphingobacteriales bacterium]